MRTARTCKRVGRATEALMAATGGTFYSANIFETWGFYAILMMHCVAILRFVHNTPLRIYYCEEKDDFVFVFSNIFQFNKVTKVSVPSGGLENNEVENKASPFTAWKFLNIVTFVKTIDLPTRLI